MGWPVLKWAAGFKMGQITNRAVTYTYVASYYIASYYIYTEICLNDLFQPLENVIYQHFIPVLTGRTLCKCLYWYIR